MSVAPISITCDRCDFRTSSSVNWGEFVYRSGNETAFVTRELGWCEECSSLTPTEVLPTEERIDQLTLQKKEVSRALSRAQEALRAEQWWLARLVRWPLKFSTQVQELKCDLAYAESEVSDAIHAATLLAGRQSGPRCLLCGSENVVQVPGLSDAMSCAPALPTQISGEFRHPGCGGALLVWQTGIRLMVSLTRRVFDSEGRLLSQGDEAGIG